jgi:multiple sugar transport system permease protein
MASGTRLARQRTVVPGAPPRRGPRRRKRRVFRSMRREWSAYVFLLPGFLVFSVFTVFGVVFSLYLSFHQWDILNPVKPYVGTRNYSGLLQDPNFRQSVVNTVYYTFVSIPLTLAAGLGAALLLNQKIRGRSFFRAIFYLPVITPLVISAIVWKFIYNGDYGLLNYYLTRLHLISQPIEWLGNPSLAMPSVIAFSVWQSFGFTMVVYLAGLQAIPQEIVEAAEVDGAGAFQRFRRVIFPMLAPTTFFLVVVMVIQSFQAFTQIAIMTGGGPIGSTTTIVFYMYQQAFQFFRMGYASAVTWALFILVFIFTVAQVRIYARRSEV